ncbi:MAG: hypothetical protein K2X47_13325 [Bdellovibrionales bacterium]|nr:hypothetical protein [Bdellovibrionales bacterium]
MMAMLDELKLRNEVLYYFGLSCWLLGVLFFAMTQLSDLQVRGANAYWKPFKFSVSIAVYVWTMAWICVYLHDFNVKAFSWWITGLLGFEIIYIGIQAFRGQLSHFNLSTPFYQLMYVGMAFAAAAVSFYTLYVAVLFLKGEFSNLPLPYVWGIRLGLLIFVIFSLEGFVMGSRLSHTIGGQDGGPGLPLSNWSTKFGDPRVAHFIGMHALQVLPFLSFYFFTNVVSVFMASGIYFLLAVFTLWQALSGRPLIAF